jgi:hypothetical protein
VEEGNKKEEERRVESDKRKRGEEGIEKSRELGKSVVVVQGKVK